MILIDFIGIFKESGHFSALKSFLIDIKRCAIDVRERSPAKYIYLTPGSLLLSWTLFYPTILQHKYMFDLNLEEEGDWGGQVELSRWTEKHAVLKKKETSVDSLRKGKSVKQGEKKNTLKDRP